MQSKPHTSTSRRDISSTVLFVPLLTRRTLRRINHWLSLLVVIAMLAGMLGINPTSGYSAAAGPGAPAAPEKATAPDTAPLLLTSPKSTQTGMLPPPARRTVTPVADPHLPSLTVHVDVTPKTLAVGDVFTVTLTIRDQAPDPAKNLKVTMPAPAGAVGYPDPHPGGWSWQQASLPGHGSATFTAKLRLTETPPGGALVAVAQATADGLDVPIHEAGGAMVVQRDLPPATAQYTPGSPAVLHSSDGRIQVKVPSHAASQPLTLKHTALPPAGSRVPPDIAGRKRGLGTFYLNATDSRGAEFRQFAGPLAVTITYTPEQLRALGISEGDLTAFRFDETQPNGGAWVPLDTTVDDVNHTATVLVDRLGGVQNDPYHTNAPLGGGDPGFQFGDGSSPSDAYIPSLKGFQVGLFQGDARFEYPIEVPAGPAGIKPNLQMRYTSSATDGGPGMRQKQQSGWAGKGWSFDTPYIALNRLPGTRDARYYTMVLNGQSFDLVRGEQRVSSPSLAKPTDWEWHPTDESFIRARAELTGTLAGRGITRFGDAVQRYMWQVWTKDGTRYDFQDDAWQTWDECDPKGKGGNAWGETYKWYVTRIEDTHGNRVNFNYGRGTEAVPESCIPMEGTIDYSVWPTSITWGGNASNADRYKVEFITSTRTIDTQSDQSSNQLGQGPQHTVRLDKIKVYSMPTSTWLLVRQYDLTFAPTTNECAACLLTDHSIEVTASPTPTPHGTWISDTEYPKLTLTKLTRLGNDGTTVLPSTVFTYSLSRGTDYYPNGGWNRLTQIDNGQGGVITMTYENIGSYLEYDHGVAHDTAGIFRNNRRVVSRVVGDGMDHNYTWSYAYYHPAYNSRGTELGGIGPHPKPNSAKVYYAAKYDPPLSDTNLLLLVQRQHTEFRGHEETIEIDPNNNHTEHWFYQGDAGCTPTATGSAILNDACFLQIRDREFLKGREYKTVVHPGSDFENNLSKTLHNFGVHFIGYTSPRSPDDTMSGLWRAFTYENRTDDERWDTSSSPVTHTMVYTYEFDYGNMTDSDERDSAGAILRTTNHSYAILTDTTHYIANRRRSDNVQNAQGQWLARTVYGYDGSLGGAYTLTHGDLTLMRKFYNWTPPGSFPDPAYSSDISYTYDTYGNRTIATTYSGPGQLSGTTWGSPGGGSAARPVTTTYESTFHVFPTKIEQPPNVNGLILTEQAGYDYGMGTMTIITDTNANVTTGEYDWFGRLFRVIKPYDSYSYATWEAGYHDTEIPFRYEVARREDTDAYNHYRLINQFYDGMGRQIQTKSESRDLAQNIVVDKVYDGLGQVTKESQPRYVDQDEPGFSGYITPTDSGIRWTTTARDGLGRPAIITATDSTKTSMSYYTYPSTGSRVIATTDANSHLTRHDSDVFGRLTAVKEYSNTTTLYATTVYTYNALDLLTGVRDNATNVTTVTYDSLGRKTQMQDPDMGHWSYTYDVNGNITSQTDALTQTIGFGYDALDRLISKTYGDEDNTHAYYFYDENVPNGKGQRTSMSRSGDQYSTAAWQYDNRGRMSQATYTVAGMAGSRTFQYAHDSADRQSVITYPTSLDATEVLTYTYDPAWRQQKMCTNIGIGGEAGCYVTNATYSALDQPENIAFGNALTQTYTYSNPMQRLSRLRVGPISNPSGLFDRSYNYDPVGNVATITNTLATPSQEVQTFGYDHRDRLASWDVTGGLSPTSEPYQYDTIGNLMLKGATYYTYSGGTGGGGPHAVHHTDEPLNTGQHYSYDANGNMLTGRGRSYTWNAENQPTFIGGGPDESYTYDAEGARVKRVVAGGTSPGTTYYVGGTHEEDTPSGKVRNLYTFNGPVVAQNEWIDQEDCIYHSLDYQAPTAAPKTDPKNGSLDSLDSKQTFKPSQDGVTNADPTVITVSTGERLNFDLTVHAGASTVVTAQQAYLTFTHALLQNVNASGPTGCTITNTVTADTATFDTSTQNEVCNGPNYCTFRGVSVAPGSIAFASGAFNSSPGSGSFRVARVGFCAMAPGQAIIHWQFSPPDPITRTTQIVSMDGSVVSVPACYADTIINISGDPVTPTSTPTDTHTPVYTPTPTKTHTPTRTPTITPTFTDTPIYTPTPTDTPTVTPTPATFLVGHVTWQGIPQPSNTPDPRNQMGITLTLRLASGGVASEYTGLTTDASGFFTVPVDTLAAGTYNWRAKGLRNLATTGTVSLPGAGGGTTQQEMGQQKAGDALTTGPTNFNVVNIADFTTLKATFGKAQGDPGYDERADFNNDRVVNSSDFTLLKGNFGQAGAPPIRPVRGEGGSGGEVAGQAGQAGQVEASAGVLTPPTPSQLSKPSKPSQPSSQGQTKGTSAHRPQTIETVQTLIYLHGDHLGSVALVTSKVGTVVSQQEFDPWGKVRTGNVTQTKRNFTGQKLDDTGLLFYNARYYDPALARFVSADSIVPGLSLGAGGALGTLGKEENSKLTVDFHETGFVSSVNGENAQIVQKGFWFQLSEEEQDSESGPSGPLNPQALSRYSYVLNNPVRYTDPTGHIIPILAILGAAALGLGSGVAIDVGIDYLTSDDKANFDWGASIGTSGKNPLTWIGIIPIGKFLKLTNLAKLGNLSGRVAKHHIFPQRVDLAEKFSAAGIKIHKFTLLIPEELHKEIHKGGPQGGYWNAAWERFFIDNPNAIAEDIYRFAGRLLHEFGLDEGYRLVPFR